MCVFEMQECENTHKHESARHAVYGMPTRGGLTNKHIQSEREEANMVCCGVQIDGKKIDLRIREVGGVVCMSLNSS